MLHIPTLLFYYLVILIIIIVIIIIAIIISVVIIKVIVPKTDCWHESNLPGAYSQVGRGGLSHCHTQLLQ